MRLSPDVSSRPFAQLEHHRIAFGLILVEGRGSGKLDECRRARQRRVDHFADGIGNLLPRRPQSRVASRSCCTTPELKVVNISFKFAIEWFTQSDIVIPEPMVKMSMKGLLYANMFENTGIIAPVVFDYPTITQYGEKIMTGRLFYESDMKTLTSESIKKEDLETIIKSCHRYSILN